MKKDLFLKFQDAKLEQKGMNLVKGSAATATDKSKSTTQGQDCTDPGSDLNQDSVITSKEFDSAQG